MKLHWMTIERAADVPIVRAVLTHTQRVVPVDGIRFFKISEDDAQYLMLTRLASGQVALFATDEHDADGPVNALLSRIHRTEVTIDAYYRVPSALLRSIQNGTVETQRGDFQEVEALNRVRDIVRAAIEANSSDIFLDAHDGAHEIAFRVNGARVHHGSMGREAAEQLMRALFRSAPRAAQPQDWRENANQDTMTTLPVDGREVRIRYSHKPAHAGSLHFALRLQVGEQRQTQPGPLADRFTAAGFTEAASRLLKSIPLLPQRIHLFSGPTGSGKTNSLRTLLEYVHDANGGESRILSVENPVELGVRGLVQSSVTFQGQDDDLDSPAIALAVQNLLRMNPDQVMVGEIRDRGTAQAIANIVLSGHTIYSTIHLKTIFSLWARMNDQFGVSRSLLATEGVVGSVIYQELVRIICPHCRVRAMTAEQIDTAPMLPSLINANGDGDAVFFRGPGCSQCSNGFARRRPLIEALFPNAAILAHFRAGRDDDAAALWDAGDGGEWSGLSIAKQVRELIYRGELCPYTQLLRSGFARLGLDKPTAPSHHIRAIA